VRTGWLWVAAGLAGAGACRSTERKTTAPSASVAAVDASAPRAAPATEADLGDPAQQFLVHAPTGEIWLRSRATGATRLLAKHADTALYHPSLELVWFLDGDRLSVADLRKPGSAPVAIARGAPAVGHLSIVHPPSSVETEDGCDVPYLSLDWTETPKVEAFLTEAPGLHIEDAGWLRAQLARPSRAVAERRDFSKPVVRVPPKLLDCESKQACGQTVPIGAGGLSLVRVLEKPGGDCIQRACLLWDPRARLFASVPKIETWGAADATAKGTCGPLMLDKTRASFLVEHYLCSIGHGCEDLKVRALGWLVPGERAGAPGNFAGP
jgi:hypothetical protein